MCSYSTWQCPGQPLHAEFPFMIVYLLILVFSLLTWQLGMCYQPCAGQISCILSG